MKKFNLGFIATLLFCYSLFLPLSTFAQGEQVGTDFSTVTLTEDLTVIGENEEHIATLHKGNLFFLSINNKIQWGDSVYEVPEEMLEVAEGDQPFIPFNLNDKSISSNSAISVIDETGLAIVTLEPNQSYPIFSETEEAYEIIIGNRIGYVKKSEQISMSTATESNMDTSTNSEDNSTQEVTREFTSSDKYFKVVEDGVFAYDNSSKSLIPVLELVKGQEYPRVKDIGNWHQIKYGNGYAYVYKGSTAPIDSVTIQNENKGVKPTSVIVKAVDNLPVYDNTSGSLVRFATILPDQQYPIIRDYGNWYQIDVSGRIGYVLKSLTEKPFTTTDQFFTVKVENLGIYENRNGSLIRVGSLEKGQSYPRIADAGNWHRIKFGTGSAYVYKKYTSPSNGAAIKNISKWTGSSADFFTPLFEIGVYDNSSGGLVKFATLTEETNYPIISENGNWYVVNVAGRTGYVYKPNTRRDFKTSDNFFKVIEPNVKIYTNDTGVLVEVATLNEGQTYPRTKDYGNWHQVRVGNKYGYVWKGSTTPDDGKSLKNVNTGQLVGSDTLVAHTDAVVVDNSTPNTLVPFATLKENVTYTYIKKSGNWYMIEIAGRLGYVHKSYVQSGYRVASPTLKVYSSFESLKLGQKSSEGSFLDYNTSVEILQVKEYGAEISTENGITGWVQRDYLDKNVNDNLWYMKDDKPLRAEPNSTSEYLGSVSAKSTVKLVDYQIGTDPTYQGWFKVKTDRGQIGWVWGNARNNNGLNMFRYEKEKMGATTNEITIFTPLTTQANVTAEQINAFIHTKTKGNTSSQMYGMGDAYLEAQRQTGLNAVYLMAHSALESGYGTSSLVNQKYNYYGIKATDSCPECASTFASKEDGIVGGAVYIAENFTYHEAYQQFTLDAMRMNGERHQYATDEAWHVKISAIAMEFVAFIEGTK
ncbi:SH3 domain-containing protein [Bacillus timonensis]|nr:SH3 domain-containing protein [Bacillus timonensis]